jgi:hypothetical protein
MPKKPTLKTASKSKKTKAAKPTTKAKAKVAKPTPRPTGRGFMWKALENKQTELKERGHLPATVLVNPDSRTKTTFSSSGFSRFNGPRRRAG